MGMAASQGRLLSMTSRMSDLEFQSQSKCQSKIKLAMSTEDITREYTEALNKKKFVGLTGYENGSPVYSDLTYDMLTGLNSPLAGDYCLTDSSDRILVTQEMKQNFDGKTLVEFLAAFNANTQTLVSPAVYPAGYDETTYPKAEKQLAAAVAGKQAIANSIPPTLIQTDAEAAAVKQQAAEANQNAYNAWQAAKGATESYVPASTASSSSSSSSKKWYQKAASSVSSAAMTVATVVVDGALSAIPGAGGGGSSTPSAGNASPVASATSVPEDPQLKALKTIEAAMKSKADNVWNYYVSLPSTGGAVRTNPAYTAAVAQLNSAKQSQGALGSVTPAVYNPTPEKTYYTNIYNRMAQGYTNQNDESKTINNKDWINNQIKNGGLFLEKFDKNGKTADQDLSGASEITEVRDTENLDIIKAKYDSDLLAIQTKDKRLDMEIKQIDTEHSALQTEVESVQKVIQKNIEGSFKTFG
jgi:hypothetical protein